MDPFNLEDQYKEYLKRVEIEEADMSLVQRVETKRAFMGGCTQMLAMIYEDISKLEEEEAVTKLDSIMDQAVDFWDKQTNEY